MFFPVIKPGKDMDFTMNTEMWNRLNGLLCESSLPLHGFCSFGAVRESLHPCRAAERLKTAFAPGSPPKTVIVVLFPYRHEDKPSNLSRYARVPDYHVAAGGVLEKAAARLREAFPDDTFLPFIDNSPIPEIRAGSLAGLGCIGDNGLLIHPEYGSWVFIGTMITDLDVPLDGHPVTRCLHCGRCARACPGQCLEHAERDTCVSRISQKKGTLTAAEERLLRKSGMAWGCDVCQEVCPLNDHAKIQPHPCFGDAYTSALTPESIADLSGRAYGWRGQAVLKRNLSLIDEKWENRYNNKE